MASVSSPTSGVAGERKSGSYYPGLEYSQIPANPTFRSAAVNCVVLIPLLSSDNPQSRSSQSFVELWNALSRHGTASIVEEEELILVVANSSLTRPGDWRYQDTPLPAFSWLHGSQRLRLFDGRPTHSRAAHDRLMHPTYSRDWIDLVPSRRTAAVVGVLNMHDCQKSVETLHRAEQELHQWVKRYSTPSYQFSAYGSGDSSRDTPVERLYVFDSFDEDCQTINLSMSNMVSQHILAFPPSDQAHAPMMDLHLNVVVNDLAVAIFRTLENRIRHSNDIAQLKMDSSAATKDATSINTPPPAVAPAPSSTSRTSALSRYISSATGSTVQDEDRSTTGSSATSKEPKTAPHAANLSLKNMASLVSPESKLGHVSDTHSHSLANTAAGVASSVLSGHNPLANRTSHHHQQQHAATPSEAAQAAIAAASADPYSSLSMKTGSTAANLKRSLHNSSATSAPPQLLTPLDQVYEANQLTIKDWEACKKRDMARREKMAADFSLLAGSPLDAYERYLRAANLSKVGNTGFVGDPLWYAFSLEGCAAAHIAMAEAGGYNVDEYLENNFQLPDDIMALLSAPHSHVGGGGGSAASESGKQTLPEVVFALCEEALSILQRHTKLATFCAQLYLKLALYTAESAELHLQCRWGKGPGSWPGEFGNPPRWETTSVSRLLKLSKQKPLRTKDDLDMIDINVYNRTKKIAELLQSAVAVRDLDPLTRVDAAARSVRLCLEGIPGTQWKIQHVHSKIRLPRKAAYFASVAAEAMTEVASSRNQSHTSGSKEHQKSQQQQQHAMAESLWLLASQLYPRTVNPSHLSGGNYGWACLRAATLHALSTNARSAVGLEATERLLSLLEKIEPTGVTSKGKSRPPPTSTPLKKVDSTDTADTDERVVGDETYRSRATKMLREGLSTMAAGSALLAAEAKWIDDEPILPRRLPQMETNLAFEGRHAIWSSIPFHSCTRAQRQCVERLTVLRKALSTSSSRTDWSLNEERIDDVPVLSLIPLSVVAPQEAILVDKSYALQLVKRKAESAQKEGGSMATFFNPFANKKGKQMLATPVAAEEESSVSLQMSNALATPLAIQQCQLNFSMGNKKIQIDGAPVSFVLPPLARDVPILFPFTVLSAGLEELSGQTECEVEGITFTCFNRSFSVPLRRPAEIRGSPTLLDVAEPITYAHRSQSRAKAANKEREVAESKPLPKIEVIPCQPRLRVVQAGMRTPLDTATAHCELNLTDGEVVTTPSFDLSNYAGPKGQGILQRLQVSVLGIPGSAEKLVFDSENPGVDLSCVAEHEFLKEFATEENPVPLKVRAKPGSAISMGSMSSASDSNSKERTIGLQLAASPYFSEKVTSGSSILTIRFRYAGKSTAIKEVWRNFDMPLVLSHSKGPRITHVTFRADMAKRNLSSELISSFESRNKNAWRSTSYNEDTTEGRATHRVGLDNIMQIASDELVAVVTVANNYESDIVLSHPEGKVGSFQETSFDTFRIPRGVTVSIPTTLNRLSRVQEMEDCSKALTEGTSMFWTSATDASSSQQSARGRLAFHRQCLHDILRKKPSLIPSIYDTPFCMVLQVQGTEISKSCESSQVSLGQPIDVSLRVTLKEWLQTELVENCSFTIDLFAIRTGGGKVSQDTARDHVWCGMASRGFVSKDLDSSQTFTHRANVVLLHSTDYVLSACCRITQKGQSRNEVWWAPQTAKVSVDPTLIPQ